MNKCEKNNITKAWQMLELELCTYNSGKYSAYYFLRRIFCFLRLHPELCEQEDYKELYDETLVLLILHSWVKNEWTKDEPTNQKEWLELLADLENAHISDSYHFNIKDVDDYLSFWKKTWGLGDKYTMELLL